MGLELVGCSWDSLLRRVAGGLQGRAKSRGLWKDWKENELWNELVSCILGSVVTFEVADRCFRFLQTSGLLVLPTYAAELEAFELRIAEALAGRRPSPSVAAAPRHPFPALRARQLRRTAEAVYFRVGSLHRVLSSGCPASVRAELIRVACGIGPKQGSLFMRNIGLGDFAVLDRHVLRFMVLRGLVPTQPHVHTLPKYERVELIFSKYAQHIGIPVHELDLSVWIAMRVLTQEGLV